jgi:hypothetical protein
MSIIDASGPKVLLQSTAGTTLTVGSWFTVNPNVSNYSFQVVLTGSSDVSTATASVSIQASNDGVNPLPETIRTFATLSLTTNTVTTGGSCTGSSMAGPWGYIRANLTSLTTSTAGSAGSPRVVVYCNAN